MRKLAFVFAALLLVAAGYLLAEERELKVFTAPKKQTTVQPAPTVRIVPALPARATLINDQLALRVEGKRQGRVVGTLLVLQDGKWTEVVLAPQNMLVGNPR
jgi:hypothetical protein